MATAPEDEEEEARTNIHQHLKAALWYAVGGIVDDESLRLDINATPQFIGALTELVWSQIGSIAKDLENFAKHADRSTVLTADVLLLARRNEGLESLLRSYVDGLRAGDSAKAIVKGKGVGKGKGKATIRAGGGRR